MLPLSQSNSAGDVSGIGGRTEVGDWIDSCAAVDSLFPDLPKPSSTSRDVICADRAGQCSLLQRHSPTIIYFNVVLPPLSFHNLGREVWFVESQALRVYLSGAAESATSERCALISPLVSSSLV